MQLSEAGRLLIQQKQHDLHGWLHDCLRSQVLPQLSNTHLLAACPASELVSGKKQQRQRPSQSCLRASCSRVCFHPSFGKYSFDSSLVKLDYILKWDYL
jgi:hypothetical protein